MSKQQKLSEMGYIFGLGAFRRYKEITGHDINHFEEALKPEFITDKDGNKVPVRDPNVDDIEVNYRWATMLKCANDVYVNINGGEKLSIDEFTVLLDSAAQEESDKLLQVYLDSNYMGKPMREYYGIPKPEAEAKKKTSQRAKPTSKR